MSRANAKAVRGFRCPARAFPLLALGMVLAGALLGSGCSNELDPSEAEARVTVRIQRGASGLGDKAFSPSPVSIATDTEVVWANGDTDTHQVASVAGFFQAPRPIAPGQSYSYIFRDGQRQYRYYCLRPGHQETGVIRVGQ